jgi:hypothetical protein
MMRPKLNCLLIFDLADSVSVGAYVCIFVCLFKASNSTGVYSVDLKPSTVKEKQRLLYEETIYRVRDNSFSCTQSIGKIYGNKEPTTANQ